MTARTLKPAPKQVDLAELWRRQVDEAKQPGRRHEPWCTGHGWMLEAGIVAVLEPLVLRDRLGDDSYFRYTPFGATTAEQLLGLLPADYLAEERQNDGPSIGGVLRALVAQPERLRAHGYVIGAGRCDERITVEGVLFRAEGTYRLCSPYEPALSSCDCDRLYQYLCTEYGLDELVPPHELTAWFGYDRTVSGEPETWYRAWWD